MARSVGFNFGGIDNALVVRIEGGALGPRARGRASTRKSVYVVPLAALQAFQLGTLPAADQRNLDNFFTTHTRPKVDAAVAFTLHIFDGSS